MRICDANMTICMLYTSTVHQHSFSCCNWVSEWVSVLGLTSYLTLNKSFQSFQPVDCTGIDNQKQENKTLHASATKTEKTPALAYKTNPWFNAPFTTYGSKRSALFSYNSGACMLLADTTIHWNLTSIDQWISSLSVITSSYAKSRYCAGYVSLQTSLCLLVKEFLKSVNIWWSCRQLLDSHALFSLHLADLAR